MIHDECKTYDEEGGYNSQNQSIFFSFDFNTHPYIQDAV